MRHILLSLLCLFGLAATTSAAAAGPLTLQSPDGRMQLSFALDSGGRPTYWLDRDGRAVVLPSRMGFTLEWRQDGLDHGFVVADVLRDAHDEVWHPVWGEEANIRNRYNELTVTLRQDDARDWEGKPFDRPTVMLVRFRLYDDGLGFRYEWPQDNSLVCFWLTGELTEFRLTGDHMAWWIPGDYDTQEFGYTQCRLSEVRGLYDQAHRNNGWPWKSFSPTGLQTALQMKTDDGLYINIHEAAALDFPTMNLDLNDTTFTLRAWLTPDATGYCGRLQAPCRSPWRTVQVCDKATDVLRSRLILNLNDPCALDDVSWIHPVKYMGVWWEMISDKMCWSYTNDYPSVRLGQTDYLRSTPHGRHAANNDNVRRYIDFAAANGFDALLVEGWNEGWEDWYGKEKAAVFDFVTPYPDFDLPALNAYAHSKGLRLIMHHESSSSLVGYERWMDTAYRLMNRYGYDAVKSGYVGRIVPHGEYHFGQPANDHYHHAVVKAAERHIMVDAHEAVRPTGLCRTWPNMIGNESAMGTEFRGRIKPGHTTILPFTRLQGGPMDYTPGIFEPDMGRVVSWDTANRMCLTICNQLGLYVTFYSPLQMAADFPEHYEQHMDAFQFIKDVAVDWDTSIYLFAEPGDLIVTARHPKTATLNQAAEGVGRLPDGKRGVVSGAARFVYALDEGQGAGVLAGREPRDVWFVGGVSDEQSREVTLRLDFLRPGVTYEAIIYVDAPDASGLPGPAYNPYAYTISTKRVTSRSKLRLRMAQCGGFAVSLREVRK